MLQSLARRDCHLPGEQIDSVKDEPLEGETPINKTGGPRLKLK
jgi:hypothetical protein